MTPICTENPFWRNDPKPFRLATMRDMYLDKAGHTAGRGVYLMRGRFYWIHSNILRDMRAGFTASLRTPSIVV